MASSIRTSLAALLGALLLGSCATPGPAVYHIVTTQSTYQCCRTIRYSTWTFPTTRGSTASGDGVVVRLLADTVAARCGGDTEIGVAISNNSDEDIYIPVSREMEGDRIKLYPWRLSYDTSGAPIRLARQLQYNDVIERTDALLRFFRLPSGREVMLHGVIPQRWLCAPATEIAPPYLNAELNPVFYSDRARALRAAEYHRDPKLPAAIGLRYDVAYTTLRYLESLPVSSRNVNASGDTVQVMVGIPEEPGEILNSTQKVAESNIVTLKFLD